MGCQATELNHFTKPFKMVLKLTNRRFNFDKFRVYEIDLSNVRRVIPGLPGRSVIRLQRIYNFLLLHAILSTVLEHYWALLSTFILFLGLTY